MRPIGVFFACTTGMFALNVAGRLIADIDPLSVESSLIIGFAVTWCIFKDRENERVQKTQKAQAASRSY